MRIEQVTAQHANGRAVLTMDGDFGREDASVLAEWLQQRSSPVVLDMADVRVMDATIIGTIVRALNEGDLMLMVRNPSKSARRALQRCGLEMLIEPQATWWSRSRRRSTPGATRSGGRLPG